jgi:superfamily II DNA or RNA helicase
MQRLLDAVRKAALPAIWSQGVKLAREGAAQAAGSKDGERVYRVRAPGQAIAPTVTLYVDDDEWSCDCGGKVDPCAHVAAAAIAAHAAHAADEKGERADPAEEEKPARVGYRLAKSGRRLAIARVVVHGDGREERLARSLASDVALGRSVPGLSPTHEDLLVDRILGNPARDVVPVDRVADVLGALASSDVTLDGRAVKTSKEPILPRAIVADGPNGGLVLRIEKDPALDEVVSLGVALCGDVLRPLGETATTGEYLEHLPLTRTFGKAQETELVTNVLPAIEKKLAVTVTTARLPRKAKSAQPRIAMDLSHHGHTLSVLPTLVYGDPPIARVQGDDVALLGAAVPVRRPDLERELLRRLRDEMNLVPGRRVDLDGVEATRFAAKLRAWQESTGDTSHAAVFEGRALVPRLLVDGDAFDVLFELDDGGDEGPARRADAVTVLRAWRDGLDLVPLEEGGWAPLPADWLAKHGQRVLDLFAARDAEKKLERAALPELGALCAALDAPRPLGLDKLAPLLEGFAGIPRATIPEDVTATLRAYQHQGVDWLAFLRDVELGGVLADDMGLGKTLQAICVLRGRSLVVCPKSVVHNWAEEIARFRPGLSVAVYHGAKRALDTRADVTLTTYATLRMDSDRIAEEAWDVVVLDEAQAVKNETSQTARAAFDLRGRFKVALSGTPVENRLEELWSVMRFANPGLLGGRSGFQERYVEPIANGDPDAAARLRAKIRPFVLRRMKKDVLPELPPRTEAVLHVELDDAERSVYDAVRVATRRDLAARLAQDGNVLAALEALLRLRQAACHPALVPGQTAGSSSKIEMLLEALEDAAADGHRALVFSQWTSLLDLVEPHLARAGIRFTRLDGKTKDRAAVVSDFQSEGGPPVMLVSLKAGGTGLNLTAADHVFLLDPWWNPAVEDQAADRAHRIGQDRPVMVYRLVAKDTVEERIFALQAKKRALADVALGEASQAGGITREELLALLE